MWAKNLASFSLSCLEFVLCAQETLQAGFAEDCLPLLCHCRAHLAMLNHNIHVKCRGKKRWTSSWIGATSALSPGNTALLIPKTAVRWGSEAPPGPVTALGPGLAIDISATSSQQAVLGWLGGPGLQASYVHLKP